MRRLRSLPTSPKYRPVCHFHAVLGLGEADGVRVFLDFPELLGHRAVGLDEVVEVFTWLGRSAFGA